MDIYIYIFEDVGLVVFVVLVSDCDQIQKTEPTRRYSPRHAASCSKTIWAVRLVAKNLVLHTWEDV